MMAMADILRIRSKKELWNDYVVKGFENGLKREQIRESLIEVIRKEVFDQMIFRLKVEDLRMAPQTPKNIKIVENISINTRNKWRSLIKECNKHLMTLNLLKEEDLEQFFPSDPEEDDEDGGYEIGEAGDWDGNEKTAEWPELNRFDDIQPAEIDGLEAVQEATAENMDEALTSGYVQVEEDPNADKHIDEGSREESTYGNYTETADYALEAVPDETLQGELEEGAGKPDPVPAAPADAAGGHDGWEIVPGMGFPPGYWTR